MKNLILSALVLTVAAMFAGCRGSSSTYTTAPTSGYTEASTVGTQSETPTINNGNGPITTAPTDAEMGISNDNESTGAQSNVQATDGTGSTNDNSAKNRSNTTGSSIGSGAGNGTGNSTSNANGSMSVGGSGMGSK